MNAIPTPLGAEIIPAGEASSSQRHANGSSQRQRAARAEERRIRREEAAAAAAKHLEDTARRMYYLRFAALPFVPSPTFLPISFPSAV